MEQASVRSKLSKEGSARDVRAASVRIIAPWVLKKIEISVAFNT